MPETWGIYGAEDITIGRPFLNCSKTRLKRTCREHSIPWFQDPTNADPTYTVRNAIRKLLYEKPCRLPKALQKPSLMEIAYRAAKWNSFIAKKANRILQDNCDVKIDYKTGTLQMKVPEIVLDELEEVEAKVLLKTLTLAAEKVTPQRTIKRRSMINVLANIFGRDHLTPMTFTAAGLLWTRGEDKLWHLRRMPHLDRSRAEATIRLTLEPEEWSNWILWDGRWWIRVRSLGPEPSEVSVRPLAKTDMKQLKSRLKQIGRSDVLEDSLQSLPGNSRFTVPVVTMEHELLVALPSFTTDLMNRRGSTIGNGKLVEYDISFRKAIIEG